MLLRGEDFHTVGEFTVSEGERIPFVLTWFPSHEEPPTPVDPEQALHDTESFWREWADRCEHPSEGPYHDEIHRMMARRASASSPPDRRCPMTIPISASCSPCFESGGSTMASPSPISDEVGLRKRSGSFSTRVRIWI